MRTIAPAELQKLLAENASLHVLDVRTPAEYSAVHVPPARNTPLASLDPQALTAAGLVEKTQPVYLLCQAGGRAAHAAAQFAAEGFEPVVVAGGTAAWIAAELPVERGAGVIDLERQVRIAAGMLVLTGIVLSFAVHPYFLGLSAFVGGGLIFAGITDWCGMGLLLAKAPWNQLRA